jgi:hypothetical protein
MEFCLEICLCGCFLHIRRIYYLGYGGRCSVAVDVPISRWLYVCMGFGALFIGLAKRMSESISVPEGIESRRKSMNYYDRKSLGLLMTTVSSISLMSHCIYTFTATNLPTNNIHDMDNSICRFWIIQIPVLG